MNRIVIVTDCTDVAFNEIRGTILSELKKIDPINKVCIEPGVFGKEFSVVNGAFLTRLIADCYPPGETTILAILNPLKTNRSDRARIIGETENGIKFVGENTGIFGWLIQDFGLKCVFESSKKGIDGNEFVSFGGKYIHAPIAARVAAGIPLATIGFPFDKNRLTFPEIKTGTVVHIDNFGVLKIADKLKNLHVGQKVKIYLNSKYKHTAIFTDSMKNLPDGTWAVYNGSSLDNLPEIGIVRVQNTAKILDANIGDIIDLRIER